MRTIALEEHFAYAAKGVSGQELSRLSRFSPQVVGRLRELDEHRIAEMDKAGIDVQVLSLNSPGVQRLGGAEAVAFAKASNDHLAEAVRRHPKRLAGFAALPTSSPKRAAEELQRTVREFGFKGAAINGHTGGRYLDEKFFWPILERAEELRVPIYIHPTIPPAPVVKAYYSGNHPQEVTQLFAMAGWGWHIETAVHVLRLILSGAMDRFPDLQVVVGHLGEGLPFMIERLDSVLSPSTTKLERPIGRYLRENVYYTFSGFNYLPVFLSLLFEMGADRIMFSADYPFGSMTKAMEFLEKLPVSPGERERIAHSNAERLLRL